MKVRLKTARSGRNGANAPGDVIDVPKPEADTLVRRGQAERVNQKGQKPSQRAETATDPEAEDREAR